MTKEERFNKMYEKLIIENNERFNTLRKKAIYEKIRNIIIGGLIIFVLILIPMANNGGKMMDIDQLLNSDCVFYEIAIFVVAFSLFFMFLEGNKSQKNTKIYREGERNYIIGYIFNSFNINFKYEPNSGINRYEYNNADFEKYDKFFSKDYINVKPSEDYRVVMSSLNVQKEEKNSEGYMTSYPVFLGTFEKERVKKYYDFFYDTLELSNKLAQTINEIEM